MGTTKASQGKQQNRKPPASEKARPKHTPFTNLGPGGHLTPPIVRPASAPNTALQADESEPALNAPACTRSPNKSSERHSGQWYCLHFTNGDTKAQGRWGGSSEVPTVIPLEVRKPQRALRSREGTAQCLPNGPIRGGEHRDSFFQHTQHCKHSALCCTRSECLGMMRDPQ